MKISPKTNNASNISSRLVAFRATLSSCRGYNVLSTSIMRCYVGGAVFCVYSSCDERLDMQLGPKLAAAKRSVTTSKFGP